MSGTTGWTDRLAELQELCRERGGALFYASNYCLGVNLMFRLNRQLAAMIGRVGGYGVRIEEVHHTQKARRPGAARPSRWPKASSTTSPISRAGSTTPRASRTPRTAWSLAGHARRPDRNPPRCAKARPGHPHRDLRVGGRHAGTETHDQEPPHAGDGAVVAAEFLCGKQGVFGMGRPAAQLKMKN